MSSGIENRTAPHCPDKYPDELLNAYINIEDVDGLYAEYAARGVEFKRGLANTLCTRVSL
jgi:hypothetical protein